MHSINKKIASNFIVAPQVTSTKPVGSCLPDNSPPFIEIFFNRNMDEDSFVLNETVGVYKVVAPTSALNTGNVNAQTTAHNTGANRGNPFRDKDLLDLTYFWAQRNHYTVALVDITRAPGNLYKLQISGVKDKKGQVAKPFTWIFEMCPE